MTDVITDNLDVWTSAIASKASVGRGSSDKQIAYGIKKLRELILELAVRGKLVSQDSNDEPAGVLLEKISAEKERLVKEGKIKKQNPLPEINDEEKPFDLPENWKWTKLGNISFINPRNEADDKSIASFVPMSFITTSHTGEHEQEAREWKEIKNGYTHFANGDIGVAKITPCFENSKAVVFSNLSNGIGAGTTELHVARPYGDTLCARYILIYLKSPEILIVGESKMTGTAGQKRIPKEFFAENPLPLPPLAEQHRIVAKVDELMVLCDQLEQQQTDHLAAHQTLVQTLLDTLTQAADAAEFEQAWSRIANHFDALFTTESSIDQLKQTLLQLAVMGKLVPHDPNDEPASILLEKIAEEHGKTGKGRTAKNKPELDLSQKVILPSSWEVALFQDITKVITCGMASTPKYYDSGRIFLSAKNVKPYRFMPDDHKFVDEETYRKITQNAKPEKGDILLTRVGAGIGEAALIDQDIDFAYYVSLTLIKPYLQYLNSTYLLHWLNSPEGVKKSLDNIYGTGMSQGNLNVNQVRMFSIPIPPLNEQHRIVAKVDELMALCDSLKARIAAAQTTQLQLADVIVEQAVA